MKGFSKVVLGLVVLLFSSQAYASKLVLSADEWLLTQKGFDTAGVASTTNFALNLASYLKGSSGPGNYLIYSDSLGFSANSTFANVLTAAGNKVTFVQSTDALPSLAGYDGVFLSGLQGGATPDALNNYMNAGGGLFIAAGNSYNPGMEAGRWNSFLGNYGFAFDQIYNGLQGVFDTTTSNHGLFAGVSGIYVDNGNNINILSTNPNSQVILSSGGHGLIGVYDSNGTSVPEPGTMMLLGSAMFGVYKRRKLAL